MTVVGLTHPPPPDFTPLGLLEAAVARYWFSLLVAALCAVLSWREMRRGEERAGQWMGIPILLQSWIALQAVIESVSFGSQLHLWCDFFVAQVALLFHVVPLAVVLYARRRRYLSSLGPWPSLGPWWAVPLAAAYTVVLDHALVLFVFSEISARLGDGG